MQQRKNQPKNEAVFTVPFSKWERTSNYIGEDYSEYYLIIARTRDGDALERSNFEATWNIFDDNNVNYIRPTFTHWACGWIEVIMIHESNIDDLKLATKLIHEPLRRYPLLDEELYAECEHDDNTFWCEQCHHDTYHEGGCRCSGCWSEV